ncbi:unnamed protein product, partial [Meganyctiphanes norvegica]
AVYLFGVTLARTLPWEKKILREDDQSWDNGRRFVDSCGGDFSSDTGTLESPGFPGFYPNNLYCFWTIKSEDGTPLTIEFTDLDVEFQRNCVYDYVMICDGPYVTSPPLANGKLCGNFKLLGFDHYNPPKFNTTGDEASIVFRSDYMNPKKGFRLKWTSIGKYMISIYLHSSLFNYQ